MILQFSPKAKSTDKPISVDDSRARKQAVVFSIFTPTKAPDGTVRYSRSGHATQVPAYAGFRGRHDPWDGGDAA